MTRRTSRTKDSLDKQKRGYKAVVKGLSFEKKVGEFLSKQGYTISSENNHASINLNVHLHGVVVESVGKWR